MQQPGFVLKLTAMETSSGVEGSVVMREWPWLIVASTLVCALSLVYFWWQHPLYGRNRGPKLLPIVGCLPQIAMNANRLYDWSTEQMQGTPTQTWRGILPGNFDWIETANAANVEHILKTNFENYPKGEFLPAIFFDLLGFGIFAADGNVWKLQRRVASPLFATRTLRDLALSSVQTELTERLVPVLDSFSDSNKVVDLQELLLRFTFDSICQLAFGSDPCCLTPGLPSVPFAEAFDEAVNLITGRAMGTSLHWPVLKFFNIGSERKIRQSLSIIDSFAFDLIRARRKELADGHRNQVSDLLSRFIPIADEFVESPDIKQKIEEDPRSKFVQASDLFLRDIVISFILAGRDTSACALTWFFWLLSSNPKVEANICKEVETILSSQPGEKQESTFSFDELKDMHYLHAALTESMRLYPPVPMDSKQAAGDDVLPDGTVISKGILTVFNMYAMGRNETIWGSDCLEFRPDRFLRDGIFVPPSPFAYPIFQAGPRICLGMDMGMMQMKLIAATLIRRYVFVVREGHCAHYGWSLTMKIVKGLPVYVRRREV
ncbi:hypothetical protein KC19_10G074900 [Ceratodon purpureus]|uniref:Cytochrome P450 n=1 Tax=Ceratodon purpureus TaxID=3225 RepID=A0A8T0GI23_CERPU|nr:hypothetical protein KC19_10G074900 [Ceratodon purpureus]